MKPIKVEATDKFYKSPMVTRDPSDTRNARTYMGKSSEGRRLVYSGKQVAVYESMAQATAAVKHILKKRSTS